MMFWTALFHALILMVSGDLGIFYQCCHLLVSLPGLGITSEGSTSVESPPSNGEDKSSNAPRGNRRLSFSLVPVVKVKKGKSAGSGRGRGGGGKRGRGRRGKINSRHKASDDDDDPSTKDVTPLDSTEQSDTRSLEKEELKGASKSNGRRMPPRKTRSRVPDEPPIADTEEPLAPSSPKHVNLTTDTSDEPIPKVKPQRSSRRIRGKKTDNASSELGSSPPPATSVMNKASQGDHKTIAAKDKKRLKKSDKTEIFSEESPDISPGDTLVDGDNGGTATMGGCDDVTHTNASNSCDLPGHAGAASNADTDGDHSDDKKASEAVAGSPSSNTSQMGRRGRGRGRRSGARGTGGGKAAVKEVKISLAKNNRLKGTYKSDDYVVHYYVYLHAFPIAAPQSPPTLHCYFTSKSNPTPSPSTLISSSPVSSQIKPCVMFTGVIDKEGERIVKELGGQLVDSVYQCTHLVTDKVRLLFRFVLFLGVYMVCGRTMKSQFVISIVFEYKMVFNA